MKKQLFSLLLLLLLFVVSSQAQQSTEALPTYSTKGSISLRTNILSWLILTPNVGIEYKISDQLGLIVEGAWAHWSLSTQNKYWRMWNVAPQARYYFGQAKYNYMGLQYTMGEYNLVGDQGKYMGGALTLGHQFFAGKNLMVDLGLSLGYLHLYNHEEYERIDGHNYRTQSKSSNGYWGPTAATISFAWKIN